MSLLREALWSVIQPIASDIAFDYAAYAEANFRLYRERVGGSTRARMADGELADEP